MRRTLCIFILGLFLISMLSFVVGVDTPVLPGDSSEEPDATDASNEPVNDAEQTQQQIDGALDNIPFDLETGEFDVSAVDGIKLKSQERLDKINSWLENNVSWLKPIFRMTPSLSWLFFVNVYIMLFFLTVLVFNASDFFFYITNKVGLYFLGLALFVILSVTSVYLHMAQFVVNLFDLIINVIIPYGVVAFVISAVVLGIAMFFFPQLALLLARIPAMIFKGNEISKVVKAGEKEIEKLKDEREVAESFNEGAGI
jgi:hypothetical protein